MLACEAARTDLVGAGVAVVPNIRVGCAVVAVKSGRIVLGRRGKEPFFGKWIIPGGGVELFERYVDTASREFREETGLDVIVGGIVHVSEIIVPLKEHRIVIYVAADVVGGCLHANSDLLEVGTFDRAEVSKLAAAGEITPTVTEVLTTLGWLGSSGYRFSDAGSNSISVRRITIESETNERKSPLIYSPRSFLRRGKKSRYYRTPYVNSDQLQFDWS